MKVYIQNPRRHAPNYS